MDYEKSYKALIESFREWLIENCDYEIDIKYLEKASDNDIISCVFDMMDYAVKPPNRQMQSLQFEILQKAFSR